MRLRGSSTVAPVALYGTTRTSTLSRCWPLQYRTSVPKHYTSLQLEACSECLCSLEGNQAPHPPRDLAGKQANAYHNLEMCISLGHTISWCAAGSARMPPARCTHNSSRTALATCRAACTPHAGGGPARALVCMVVPGPGLQHGARGASASLSSVSDGGTAARRSRASAQATERLVVALGLATFATAWQALRKLVGLHFVHPRPPRPRTPPARTPQAPPPTREELVAPVAAVMGVAPGTTGTGTVVRVVPCSAVQLALPLPLLLLLLPLLHRPPASATVHACRVAPSAQCTAFWGLWMPFKADKPPCLWHQRRQAPGHLQSKHWQQRQPPCTSRNRRTLDWICQVTRVLASLTSALLCA